MAIHFTEEEKEQLRRNPSEIYQKRTEETNRQDVEQLSGKGKWQYFKDYYLKITVVALVVLALIVTFLVQAMTRKPSCALYIAIQKDALDENRVAAFADALEEHMKLDRELETVTVDTDCTDHQLQAYFYTGTADILITSEENFKQWGSAEYFFDLEKDKEVAFYREYEEKYRYHTKYITEEDVLNNKETAKTEKGSDQTEYTCGLYLVDSEKYRQLSSGLKNPVVGISRMTEHLTEARNFVRYMMDNSQEMELREQEEKS